MNIINSITAWFAGLFKKEKTMNLTAISLALVIGATAQLTSSEAATYSSSDSSILVVDGNGQVIAVGAGAATVTATSVADPTVTSAADFTVTEAAAPVVQPTPAAIVDTDKLKALLITLGHDIEVEWAHLIALAQKAV